MNAIVFATAKFGMTSMPNQALYGSDVPIVTLCARVPSWTATYQKTQILSYALRRPHHVDMVASVTTTA
jgi:hypothetical protein